MAQTRMSLKEIEALYPQQWILIDEPTWDESNRLIAGVAVFAHSEKDDVYRKCKELELKRFAIHSTKKDPPGTRYLMNYVVGPDGSLVSIFEGLKAAKQTSEKLTEK